MKHVIFAIALVLYVLYGGQNWHHYTAALMLRAWIRYDGNLAVKL